MTINISFYAKHSFLFSHAGKNTSLIASHCICSITCGKIMRRQHIRWYVDTISDSMSSEPVLNPPTTEIEKWTNWVTCQWCSAAPTVSLYGFLIKPMSTCLLSRSKNVVTLTRVYIRPECMTLHIFNSSRFTMFHCAKCNSVFLLCSHWGVIASNLALRA